MRRGILPGLLCLALAAGGWGQTSGKSELGTDWVEAAGKTSATAYTIHGATPRQEALLRAQIQIMQPDIFPRRVIFVPHWQYIYAAKMYHLHVPTGMASRMFTHFASRSVFIDIDHYGDDDSLGYWMAHELGHLAANSADENDAEKAAKPYRRRLKEAPLVSLD